MTAMPWLSFAGPVCLSKPSLPLDAHGELSVTGQNYSVRPTLPV